MALGIVLTVAAIIGMIMAHFPAGQDGAVFGSMSGSLSIISLAVCLFFLKKMGNMCGCQCEVPKK